MDPALATDLDPEQREAVLSDATTLCVLASAGSGKTRVLTRRVARRVLDRSADPAHTLVLTFTRKAADELRQRLWTLGTGEDITTGTFHAIAYAQLRQRWLDQGRAVPVIAASPARILDTALATLRMTRSVNPRAMAQEISWAKSHRLLPENYEQGLQRFYHRGPISATQMVKVYDAYESEKRKRRVLDYDDLLLLMTDALMRDKAFAAAQRWKFRHFFVDEFQDLNQAQFDLLQQWMGEHDDLFLVGDPNQAIYGWNGADSSFLIEIERHYPDVVKVELRNNYRSSGHVLAAANAVLPTTQTRAPAQDVDDEAILDLSDDGVPPSVRQYETDEAEGRGIAVEVRKAHGRGWRWADIAILVRTNAQRSVIERALEQVEIPFRSAGGAGWLHRPEVREALEHLRQSPRHRLMERAADIEEIAKEAGPGAREYIDELLMSCEQALAEDPQMSIADFLSWVEVASRQDGPVGMHSGAVTVTTFHRAKGLEWPVVFLAGIEAGLVPYGKASGTALDEERRLFYVAITRARQELHCSWAQRRTTASGVSQQSPSPWLEPMTKAGALIEETAVTPGTARASIEAGREALHVAVDEPQLDGTRIALERWRSARARLTGIAPQLILSDETVEAIIDLRPESQEELAAIKGFGSVRAASVGDQILTIVSGSSA